nr:helix-turn-helix domain-containing protein [Roseobacter sp. H9]
MVAAIGLQAQDLLLLDTFAAFTRPQDGEAGRRLIVWASNNFLTEQTGFSLSTLSHASNRDNKGPGDHPQAGARSSGSETGQQGRL